MLKGLKNITLHLILKIDAGIFDLIQKRGSPQTLFTAR